jgi:acyl-CoA thioester hydrolase
MTDTMQGKSFVLPIRVRFGDTDPYGVVYFASYFRYCHHGIEEFLRQSGLPPEEFFRNREEGFGLPVVGANCDFLKPVKYGDDLQLSVAVLRLKDKAVTFGFQFYYMGTDQLVAKGEATIVAIDRTWNARSLPERLRQAMTAYMD